MLCPSSPSPALVRQCLLSMWPPSRHQIQIPVPWRLRRPLSSLPAHPVCSSRRPDPHAQAMLLSVLPANFTASCQCHGSVEVPRRCCSVAMYACFSSPPSIQASSAPRIACSSTVTAGTGPSVPTTPGAPTPTTAAGQRRRVCRTASTPTPEMRQISGFGDLVL